jgi:hypothetical protein
MMIIVTFYKEANLFFFKLRHSKMLLKNCYRINIVFSVILLFFGYSLYIIQNP